MGEIGEVEFDVEMNKIGAVGGTGAPTNSSTGSVEKFDPDDYESLPSQSIYVHMIAGAAAGMMEHTVMYPIDLMKGILSTFRGVNAIALGAIPAHALYFSVYEKLKFYLTSGKSGHNNTWAYGLAGIAATVVHDAVMNPAEDEMFIDKKPATPKTSVIKQRMQMCASPYSSAMECARCVLKQEGIRAFYKSYSTQLALNIPFQSVHFMSYEFVTHSLNPSHKYDPKTHLIAGACGGGIAAALTTPFDVIKTVLNTQQGPLDVTHAPNSSMMGRTAASFVQQSTNPNLARTAHTTANNLPPGFCKVGYNGISDAVKGIYSTRGFAGFYSGFQARVLTQMPATAISWSVYELCKYLLAFTEAK